MNNNHSQNPLTQNILRHGSLSGFNPRSSFTKYEAQKIDSPGLNSHQNSPMQIDNNCDLESHSHGSSIQNQLKINQKILRQKLIGLFKKDKNRYHQICDSYMNDLGFDSLCQNIQNLIQFIKQNQPKRKEPNISLQFLQQNQPTQIGPNLSNVKLSIFPQNVSFIASIFSRDKVNILLQLYATNHKILNFLNFLLISLRSFIFTNQKQWILMKDQIQRYLFKYEENVERIYEVDYDDDEVDKFTANIISRRDSNPEKTKQIKKVGRNRQRKLRNKVSLQHYKVQTAKLRKKIIQHQQSMCLALRNSFFATYQKFELMIDQVKEHMLFIYTLIEKTENFKQSNEKYLIKTFLLQSRRKGIESMIFLEKTYIYVIEKLETSRRRILKGVKQSQRKKLFKNVQDLPNYKQVSTKYKKTNKEINRMLEKFELNLKIKKLSTQPSWKEIIIEDSEQQDDSQCVQIKMTDQKSLKKQKQKSILSRIIESTKTEVTNEKQKTKQSQSKITQELKNDPDWECELTKQYKSKKTHKIKKDTNTQAIRQKRLRKQKIKKQKECINLCSIQSEDNQSSSLEFLAFDRLKSQQKIVKNQDQLQDKPVYSSMKKEKRNGHYEDIESLSIEIPFSLHYDDKSIDIEDIDDSNSEKKSPKIDSTLKKADNVSTHSCNATITL